MMTKRIYQRVLMAAAVAVLSFAMASCVDNFDNSTRPSEQEQQAEDAQQAKAQKFWAVASQLVDVDDYTEDYEGKTFESTYGVEGSEAGTRYVYTNDAATAAERFADLVDRDDIDETTQSYTYDDPDVGTLIYNKGSGRILATVDVSIKQIPSLKKIVYVPGAYANGSFQGRAYYRFGDVVKRQVLDYDGNNVDEYWICVRPSFGPESKGDSHWVCLNVLPKKNVWFYHSDNSNRDYYLPTGLGKNEEHMQNLAEMLYAIYFPSEWQANVSDVANTSLRMFHDFNKTKYTLHNKYFWTDVCQQWREKEILKNALNYSEDESSFRVMLSGDGIRLLHSGLSWLKTFSWNCSLYEAHYQNGTAAKEKNMHKATLDEPTHNMQDALVDCRKTGLDNYDDYKNFFDDDHHPRWTIRHATGKELATPGAGYDKQRAIQGVEEVYRYYRDVEPTADDVYATTNPEETPAEVAKEKAKVGHIIANNGKIYRSYDAAQENGEGAAAMVVWIGDDKRVEKDKDWNALAIALKDATTDNALKFSFSQNQEDGSVCSSVMADYKYFANYLDGWAMTQRLKNHECGAGHSHPAAETVGAMARIEGYSEWFIPSIGQWDLAMQSMGYGTLNANAHVPQYTKQGHWLWDEAVAEDAALKDEDPYMTITLSIFDDGHIGYRSFFNGSQYKNFSMDGLTDRSYVRPFLAFKVGQGGSVNPEEPWKPLEQPKVGSWIGTDGKFYDKWADAHANTGQMPVAYVVWLGGDKRVETNENWNGLAIALNDIEGKALYMEAQEKTSCTFYNAAAPRHIAGCCDGWYFTKRMYEKRCSQSHSHPAAEAVWTKAKINGADFSEWFIPDAGQWDLAMQGMGCGTYSDLGNNNWGYPQHGQWNLLKSEMASADFELEKYMTMTMYSTKYAEGTSFEVDGYIYLYDAFSKKFKIGSQTSADYRIRPFVAFKYGNGGSVNPARLWKPLAAPQAKSWMGQNGSFYKESDDVWADTQYMPVAYVVYYGAEASVDVNGKKYRGLAIGLYHDNNTFKSITWDNAVKQVEKYHSILSDAKIDEHGYSRWFVPTKDHWKLAIEQGFGFQFNQNNTVPESVMGEKVLEINNFFRANHLSPAAFDGTYWTSTADGGNNAYVIDLNSKQSIRFLTTNKNDTRSGNSPLFLRPMIAF